MLNIKAEKGSHGRQVNPPATIFSTTRPGSRPACVASYTEKKLFVLKNYVFYENRSTDGEQNEVPEKSPKNCYTFNSRTDGSDPVPRKSAINHLADRRKAKPKSWVPNGGGMKPYNSPEVQNAIPPADECIIDVTTVKPKVDTWFRPRNDAKLANKWVKSNKYDDADVKRTRGTRNQVSDEAPNPRGNKCCGKTVKKMTSFWDSHLKSQPHSMAAMLQKSHMSLDSYTRLEEIRKEQGAAAKNSADRPKSQGSDCVVQEHTLRPSELLNRQGKLMSIEDILINAKFDDQTKKQSNPQTFSSECDSKQSDNGQKLPECSSDAPLQSSNEMVNISAKLQVDSFKNPISTETNRKTSRPKHVVRLYPRWTLFFRVLMLMFRPVVGTIRQRALVRKNQSGCVEAKNDTALKVAECPKEDISDLQNFFMGSEATGQVIPVVEDISLNVSSTHRIQDEDDDLWCLASCPLVCESPITKQIDEKAEVLSKYPLEEPKESLTWQQPISNGGLRIAVYIENRVLVSFVLVQAALVLIVLSIKWLQRLTS